MNRLALALLLAVPATAARPAFAAPGDTLVRRIPVAATLAFPKDSAFVTLPFELDRNHIVVPVRLEGSGPMRATLDTGAGATVLFSDSTARALGMQPTREARMQGAGGGGVIHGYLYEDAHLKLGGLAMSGAPLVTAPDSSHRSSPLRGKLVIGRDLFLGAVVEIDWAHKVVRLHDPARFRYRGPGATVPIALGRSGLAYVNARVALQPDSAFDVKLVVDTGASHYLSLEAGSDPRLRVPEGAPRERLGIGASGAVYGAKGTAVSFELGGVTFHDVPVTFPDASIGVPPEAGRQGNLGSGLLSRFRMFVDLAGRRLILEPGPDVGAPLMPLPPLPE